jgi:hypothetical protein
MAVHLLDVNVLVALLWPTHDQHAAAQRWFNAHAASGWATTPFTQAGFIRVSSNPVFTAQAVPPREAVRALRNSLRHPAHRFIADDRPYLEACGPLLPHLDGHRQVMDAYLLGIAAHHRLRVVSFDRGLSHLARLADWRHVDLLSAGH